MIWLLVVACLAASVPAGLRWLRVAQREHYLAGEVVRFGWRWWMGTTTLNVFLLAGSLAAGLITLFDARFGFVVALVAAVGPVGLGIKGSTSPLAWTTRLRRLAVVTGGLLLVPLLISGIFDLAALVVWPLLAITVLVDLALRILDPYERRTGTAWVTRAAAKLGSVGPDVVAITGSYGKTTTKNYVGHLLAGSKRVVASPASFNNRMGLARALNENLTPGTEVFIAEMGTYGRGEIAELCGWIPPKVAAMVSIGPVHLERFGTLEEIVAAKSEILDAAEIGVICTDHPLLAGLAADRSGSMQIIEVSTTGGIVVGGLRVTEAPEGVFPANLAVALGICSALGVALEDVLDRIYDLPTAEHRQSVTTGAGGFTIIDDTFNSNPDGARSALDALARVGGKGRTAVITPGMVELGSVQYEENRRFASEAVEQVDDLVIVGRTNRRALLAGSVNGPASVTVVNSRAEAVEWARSNLGSGDAVLYENDLPDHYP